MLSTLRGKKTVEAPPLTVENVLKFMNVQEVKDWRKVGLELLLGVTNRTKQLDVIQREYSSNEDRKRAVVQQWLEGEAHLRSWRWLLLALDHAGDIQVADPIRGFTEPPRDPTLNAANIKPIMEAVGDWRQLDVSLSIPDAIVERITKQHTTNKTQSCAAGEWWVHTYPYPSWDNLADALYHSGEDKALDKVAQYLPKADPTLTTENLMEVVRGVEGRWKDLGNELGVRDSEMQKIQRLYQSDHQKMEAIINHYVRHKPSRSWKRVASELERMQLPQLAEVVTTKYVRARSQQVFDNAMKHGHVECRDIKVLIFGSAGTGKTHTIALIMEEDPPTVRHSTPCAKRPVRAVSRARIERKGKKWVRVDHDDLSQKIVDESIMLASDLVPGMSPAASSSTMTTAGGSEAGASSPTKTPSTDGASGSPISHEKLSSTPSFHTEEELLQRIDKLPYGKYTRKAFEQDRISLFDTGGQPQFHEVLPIFMQYASASIFVMKLSDRLSDHPVIEFYDDNGCLVSKAYHSAYTNQQILIQYMRVMQSQASKGFCPMSFYIGTHKDLEHQCAETRKEKNLKLLEMLLPAVHSNTFFYGEKTEEPIFPLNVKTPGPEEHQIAEELRRLIVEKSSVKLKPIPLRWHALELALQKLMLELKRGVLSKAECFEVARRYHFDSESFEEALRYLHKLNILFYYEDVLPDVIFCDPQVLLDKITELVEHSYRLKTDPSKGTPTEGNIWKFRDQGIVTLEFLNKPCFTKHYVEGLFHPVELLNLFKKLLIVSQITEEEYLMPCLLPVADEPSLLSPSGSVPSLLFYFPGSPLLGVFCGLIAYLLSQGKWKLLPKADSPYPVAAKLDRNTVHFEVPGGLPGKVILTDSFSTYFQVDIQVPQNAPSDMCSEVCPEIQETIMKGIRVASKNLHYSNSIPKLSFICFEHTDKHTPHPTVINRNSRLMKCTVNSEVCSVVKDDYQVWFGTACGTIPLHVLSEPQLKDLEFVLVNKWYDLGLQLEVKDAELELIKRNNQEDLEACREMFRVWLRMSSSPSYQQLVGALVTVGEVEEAKYLCEKYDTPLSDASRQPPSTTSLKGIFTAAVENQQHYQAYERALKEEKEIPIKYLKVLFFGPPRTGKTSMRRRLIGEIQNLENEPEVQASTCTAEVHDVIVKLLEDKTTMSTSVIRKSEWLSVKALFGGEQNTHATDLDEEAQLLYQFICGCNSMSPDFSTKTTPLHENRSPDHIKPTFPPIANISFPVIEEEAQAQSNQMSLAMTKTDISSPASPKTAGSNPITSVGEPGYVLSSKQIEEINKAIGAFNKLLHGPGKEPLNVLLNEVMLMNMVDTGGQPAFLEMLPALTMGPALYLIFFRLNQELKKRYHIQYVSKDNEVIQLGDSSYTVEEVIFQALSSIACFSCTEAKKANLPIPSHAAMLIGTHKDQLGSDSENEIKAKDDELKKNLKEILDTVFESDKNFLHHAKEDQLMFTIDNVKGDDTELTEVRKRLLEVIEQMFSDKFLIPATWLMFSIFLRKMGKRIMRLLECHEIGDRLKVQDTDEALWFLHHYVGVVLHFPEVKGIEDIVICDPQVVFDSVTDLILNSFKLKWVRKEICEKFEKTGQFSLKDIWNIKKISERENLPLSKLIKLLEHLNIIAAIKAEESSPHLDAHQELYFMPAVLKHATEEELQMKQSSTDPVPLMIHFKCGFVPVGVFCAMIAGLVAQQQTLGWILQEPCRYFYEGTHMEPGDGQILCKNKVTFRIDGSYDVTLISKPKWYEIYITCISGTDRLLVEICQQVLKTACNTLDEVICKMKYKQNLISPFSKQSIYALGFKCPKHQNSDHLAINRLRSGVKLTFQCAKSLWLNYLNEKSIMICPIGGGKAIDLKDTRLYPSFAQQRQTLVWFAVDPPKITQHPKNQTVSIGADITFTVKATGNNLQFQWQKNNENIDNSNASRFSFQQRDNVSTLQIHCVEESDKGHYKCIVKNAIEQTSEEADLTVYTSPSAAAKQPSPSTCSPAGMITTAMKPRLVQLMKLKNAKGEKIEIIKTIAPDWRQVGFLMDLDPKGRTVMNIEKQHGHKHDGPVTCCQEIFTLWLDQPDATWGNLVELLIDSEQKDLAEQVKDTLAL